MKLSIIIVSYNVKYYLEQCLWSVLRAAEGVEAEVYVVDNHSHDGSVEYLRPRFPGVHFIASNHNLGFSRANNIAIRQTESDYVLLLNPDTVVGEQTLRRCLQFMDEHPQAGGLGVKMLSATGAKARESRRGLPTPLTAFYKMCGLCERYPQSRRFAKYYMSYLSWDEAAQIEVISGAFFLLRRQALQKVGLLDEDYFMYGEDVDLSYCLLQQGYENWYVPECILHYKGESTQKSSFRYVHVFYDAMLIFLRKHYSHLGFWISIPVKAAIYFKAFTAMMQMLPYLMRKMLGFTTVSREAATHYVFMGGADVMQSCRQLAKNRGLQADFIVCSEQTRPQGHLDMLDRLAADRQHVIVYDTSAFSIAHILSIFEQHPQEHLHMGTYSPATGILITGKEVLS